MTREELPQEASREDKMRDALKHYEELATKACWHLSAIPDAIRAYYASLPPAEGAEAIVKKYEDEYDFKFHWVQRDRVIRMMREFAAQQQPTAEGAEEIVRKYCHTCFSRSTGQEEVWSSLESVIIAVQEFATLHAQRIADKMVEEKWINVKDGLPEKDGKSSIYCLVNSKYDGIVVRPYNEYHKCWDAEDADDYYCDAIDGKITHWMPLPNPPIK